MDSGGVRMVKWTLRVGVGDACCVVLSVREGDSVCAVALGVGLGEVDCIAVAVVRGVGVEGRVRDVLVVCEGEEVAGDVDEEVVVGVGDGVEAAEGEYLGLGDGEEVGVGEEAELGVGVPE